MTSCLLSRTPSPRQKLVYSKRKEFAPKRSKFFPFRVDPFLLVGKTYFNSCLPWTCLNSCLIHQPLSGSFWFVSKEKEKRERRANIEEEGNNGEWRKTWKPKGRNGRNSDIHPHFLHLKSRRQYFEIFFLFFPGDNLHEMLNSVFWKKLEKKIF